MDKIIIQSLFVNTLYFIIIRSLSRLRFPLFRFVLIIIISAALMAILCINDTLSGFSNITNLFFAIFFLFSQTKDLVISFCYSAFGMIIMFAANIFSLFIFCVALNNAAFNSEDPLHIFLLYTIFGIIGYLLSKLLGLLIHKKIKDIFAQLNRKYIFFLIFGISIVLLFFYYQFFIAQYLTEDPLIIAAIGITACIFYVVFLLVAVSAFITGVKKSIETAHKQELLDQLQGYTSNLESINSDMRKFRHDYMNIITALYGYIEAGDLEELGQYFINNIVPIEKRIESTNSTLDRLKNIQVLEIKGLAALKLLHAQELGAAVHIEVPDEIQSINFDIIDLTRIIGNFLDNALEACLETERKVLEFALFNEYNVKVIIIANSFCEPPPPISEIYKDGFSTKGEKRGLGLYTVRNIVDRSNDIILNTYIENDLFVQELKISDSLTEGE